MISTWLEEMVQTTLVPQVERSRIKDNGVRWDKTQWCGTKVGRTRVKEAIHPLEEGRVHLADSPQVDLRPRIMGHRKDRDPHGDMRLSRILTGPPHLDLRKGLCMDNDRGDRPKARTPGIKIHDQEHLQETRPDLATPDNHREISSRPEPQKLVADLQAEMLT